jgi:GNAT superfamily N-acetyltransferase
MDAPERPEAVDAARAIADERYPDADLVILAGSVALGRATPTSDLDLVIVSVEDEEAPFRESFTALGWPVEAFVHTPETVRGFMRVDVAERGRGMPRMVSTGVVIRDVARIAEGLRDEALTMIEAGPPPMSVEDLEFRRYVVTDLLHDFLGDPSGEESSLTAAHLAEETARLHLILARAWQGNGKWLLRELREADPPFADRWVAAVDAHRSGDAGPMERLAVEVLEESGGPLFEGYRASGKEVLRRFLESSTG